MAKTPSASPTITNKKARHRFELLETLEAGIALTGSEVKSLRNGKASLEEAYAHLRGDELYLLGCHINPYPMAGYAQHHPTRERKLLLHKRQIKKWSNKVQQRGQTVVPLELYFNERGKVKVKLALARGKSVSDKRTDIKKRDQQRDMEQALRRRR